MKKSLIIFAICQICFLLIACAEQHTNPSIKCPSGRDSEEKNRDSQPSLVYPFNPDAPPHSIDELQTFCNKMKNHFVQSNLTIPQAQNIYEQLAANPKQFSSKNAFWFENRCDYVPDCIDTPFEMDKQIMLKKINATEIELFIHYMRCGFNYLHLKITIEKDEITQLTFIEHWREHYLCRINLSEGG